jgi:rhamnosyltransferase
MTEKNIIIRTYNEAKILSRTLDALMGQVEQSFEIIIVDSGSTDATLKIARQYDSVKVIEIPKQKFTYGCALNIGIEATAKEVKFIVILSAHAVPGDDMWLLKLIEPLKDKKIAATYGRQLPHPDCNPFEKISLSEWYGADIRTQTDDAFFSTANAAIKKEIWEKIPFDETLPYAEDQKWAKEVQKHGFVVAYQPSAAVYHSHNENLIKVYRRSLHEAIALTQMGVMKVQSLGEFICQWRKELLTDLQSIKITNSAKRWAAYAPFYRFAKSYGRYRGAIHHRENNPR